MNLCAEIVAAGGQLALSLVGPSLAGLVSSSGAGSAVSPAAVPLAAVRVDVDQTVVLAFVVFIALVVVLKPLIFDPMMRVFELREQRTEGVRAEARSMQERAGELLRKYERELEKVHKVAAEERERSRQETAKLEAQILTEARAAAAAIVEEGRRAAAVELGAARRQLAEQAPSLARELAAAVLGREVRP